MTTLPSDEELFTTIAGIVASSLDIGSDEVKRESRLFLELKAESIDIVDIRFQIEEKYGIKIDQEDLINKVGDNLTIPEVAERFTVGFIVSYVHKLLTAKGSA